VDASAGEKRKSEASARENRKRRGRARGRKESFTSRERLEVAVGGRGWPWVAVGGGRWEGNRLQRHTLCSLVGHLSAPSEAEAQLTNRVASPTPSIIFLSANLCPMLEDGVVLGDFRVALAVPGISVRGAQVCLVLSKSSLG
jgi:hypothetical protein